MTVIDTVDWYVGQTYPEFDIPLATDNGNEDLTGVTIANFSVWFKTLNGAETQGTGTVTALNINPGEIVYQQSVADMAAAFNGYIVIKALYPPNNNTTSAPVFDPIPFQIKAS